MPLLRAAALADLPPGGRLALDVCGHPIAIFHVEGQLYAIEDRCPHQMAPLNDGELHGTRLTCRWHGWSFELDPAKPAAAIALPHVRRYDVTEKDGVIYVDVPVTSGGSSPGVSIQ